MKTNKVKVALIESEAGWGQRIDEIREFPSLAKAEAFVTKFNSHNKEEVTPKWYMFAQLIKN